MEAVVVISHKEVGRARKDKIKYFHPHLRPTSSQFFHYSSPGLYLQ